MHDSVPLNFIVIQPRAIYSLSFVIGVTIASAYYLGKKVARVELREKNMSYNETPI